MFRKLAFPITATALFILAAALFMILVGTGGCAHEKTVHQPEKAVESDDAQVAIETRLPKTVTTLEQGGQEAVQAASTYQPVFFDFDRYDIRPDQRATVEADARAVPERASLKLVGYCDERGSFDYNLALGERRALAVGHALQARGVDGRRIAVVSLGKEKATGHDEAGWAADRRVEVVGQ